MDRRGFLGTLMALAGATALDPSALWVPAPIADLPFVSPGAILTLEQITRGIVRGLIARGVQGELIPTASKLGVGPLRQQRNVAMWVPETVDAAGLDPERYIEPIAASFAEHVEKFKYFGLLPSVHNPLIGLRCCVITDDPGSGISVRGLEAPYRPDPDFYPQFRFDIIGG